MSRQARVVGAGLILPAGETVGNPLPDERVLVVKSDGTAALQNPDGTQSAIGGGAPSVYITTLGVASAALNVAGLNPAVDGDYDVYSVLNIAQANATVKFQPNSADTNATSMSGNYLNGTVARADFSLAKSGVSPYLFAAGTKIVMEGRIFAKTGRLRYFRIGWTLFQTGAAADAGNMFGIWNDTSTALANVNIASTAGALDIGSFLRLTAVAQPS